MGSRGSKRKRPDDEITADDAAYESAKEKNPRKSKKLKARAESAPKAESLLEQALDAGEHTQGGGGIMKAKKNEKNTTAAETVCSVGTPAEYLVRKQASDEAYIVDDVSANRSKEVSIQKQKRYKLGKPGNSNTVPFEGSHGSRHTVTKKMNNITSGEADANDDEGIAAVVSTSSAMQAEETFRRTGVESFQVSRKQPVSKKNKVDTKSMVMNPVSPLDPVKSCSRAGLDNATTAFDPPTGPRHLVSGKNTVCLTRHINVDKYCVAEIVGKGGQVVKKLEQETGAKIQFIDSPNSRELYKRCRITGSQTAVAQARSRIIMAEAAWAQNQAGIVSGATLASRQRTEPAFSTSLPASRTESQDHTESNQSNTLSASVTAEASNTSKSSLPLRPLTPTSTLVQPSQELDAILEEIGPVARSLNCHKSNTISKNTGSELTTSIQESQQVADRAKPGPSACLLPIDRRHRCSTPPRSPSPDLVIGQDKSNAARRKATKAIPKDAVLIKIEDDSDSNSNSSTLSTVQHAPSKKDRSIAAGISPQWLDEEIEAVLAQRKAETKKAERKSRMQTYVLEYLGVSEEQMDLIQQRCNKTRNGKWDGNCLAILGKKRVGKK